MWCTNLQLCNKYIHKYVYLCIMPGWRKPVAWSQLVRNSAEWSIRGILMKKPVTGPLDLASPGFRKQCSLLASFSSTALWHSKTEQQQRNSQEHTAKQHMSQRYTTQHGTTQHSTLNNILVSAQKNVNQRIVLYTAHCTSGRLHKSTLTQQNSTAKQLSAQQPCSNQHTVQQHHVTVNYTQEHTRQQNPSQSTLHNNIVYNSIVQ